MAIGALVEDDGIDRGVPRAAMSLSTELRLLAEEVVRIDPLPGNKTVPLDGEHTNDIREERAQEFGEGLGLMQEWGERVNAEDLA